MRKKLKEGKSSKEYLSVLPGIRLTNNQPDAE